ncbi:hypothetical protein [Geodermatophilus poikilotrophus]|uniref:Uncharacterized protein n=1 Tax=Geodermatophilus poikilotrophus TaxID=1333667 RepID=A0A1I0IQN5_9ACTN|nr:hypothetical protein [Geodermatophilus poikilotrophus]SET98698.1 hypothetical protein SAMN04488546_4558 [Geodermatophilus poikilotrophus]
MDGLPRSSTARRLRAGAGHATLAAVIALVGLVALPGTASASGTHTVKPVLNCYRENPDDSWTVVVGYVNSSRTTVDIPRGPGNQALPSRFASLPPTSFRPGTVNGAFTAVVSRADLYAGARWVLDGYTLDYRAAASSSPACPSSTELPAQGNGLGPAIGLAAAGVVGTVWVLRARARGTAGGRDDA